MLERCIETCPDQLWNKKLSGFVFWQQLIHALTGIHSWLKEEKLEEIPSFAIYSGKNVFPDFGYDPEIMLTKTDVHILFRETKRTAEKWFNGKDDDWLKKPIFNTFTNFDNTLSHLRHLMYHAGHCEAIFRENNIPPGDYLDYLG
jgi:hypothetical protein